MDKLNKIIIETEKIANSSKSDFEKFKTLFELQKLASSETWSENKEYSLKANDVYYFVQEKWNRIYEKTDEKTKKSIDEVINLWVMK